MMERARSMLGVQHGPAFAAAEHPDRPLINPGRRAVTAVAAVRARRSPGVSRIVHCGPPRAWPMAEMLAVPRTTPTLARPLRALSLSISSKHPP